MWDKDLFFMQFLNSRALVQLKSGGANGNSVTKPRTHIALGDLLSLAGVRQGAHTQIRDGHSRAGSERDQHQESPHAAVQGQLQAVRLLEWQCRDIHFTSGKAETRERKAVNLWPLQNLQSTPHVYFSTPKPQPGTGGHWGFPGS